MPTYEFRCPDGHVFDQFYRTISAAQAEVPCPQCGKPAQRQISGGAGLAFKGSGFYLTDYGKNAHRGGSSTSKPSEGGSSSSGVSKPASGGESKPSGGGSSSGGSSSGGSSSSGGAA